MLLFGALVIARSDKNVISLLAELVNVLESMSVCFHSVYLQHRINICSLSGNKKQLQLQMFVQPVDF